MTQQEFNDFINGDDLTVNELSSDNNWKTNFYLIGKNFESLVLWLNAFKSAFVMFKDSISVDQISQDVILHLTSNKTILTLANNLNVGFSDLQTSGGVTYKIKRIDVYSLEITNESNQNWDVSQLMVQIKQLDGTFVYPVVKTNQEAKKIEIQFIDGILQNYTMFFI